MKVKGSDGDSANKHRVVIPDTVSGKRANRALATNRARDWSKIADGKADPSTKAGNN